MDNFVTIEKIIEVKRKGLLLVTEKYVHKLGLGFLSITDFQKNIPTLAVLQPGSDASA